MILNAGKMAAIDETGMEHDSDDSNAIHIKMKVTAASFFVHFKLLRKSRGGWSVRRMRLFLLRMFSSRLREQQKYTQAFYQ